MNDTNGAGRFASHKITNAALDRMAAIVEAQVTGQGLDIPERLRIARDFDMEIEHAAGNPTLRSMIESLSIIGHERRARSVESLLLHPEVACAGWRIIVTCWRRSACAIRTGRAGLPPPRHRGH
jgi:DNA-binding GntR family transcriptional regulator